MFVDRAVAQHDEFVAADTGHHVGGSGGVHQTAGHLHQQRVAHIVAGVVVGVLQLVEVEEQQRDLAAAAAYPLDRVGSVAQQQHAVGEAGEPVVGGLVQQFALRPVARGDVADDATPVLDDALLVAADDHVDVEQSLDPVGAAEHGLARPLHRRRGGEQRPGDLVAQGLQQGPHCRVAHQVDRVVDAEQAAGRGVAVQRCAVAVEDDDRVRRRVDHTEQSGEQAAVGDGVGVVDGDTGVPDMAARLIELGTGTDAHPAQLPVAVPHPEGHREVGRLVGGGPPGSFGYRPVGGVGVGPRCGACPRNLPAQCERAECSVGRGDATIAVGAKDRYRQGGKRLLDVDSSLGNSMSCHENAATRSEPTIDTSDLCCHERRALHGGQQIGPVSPVAELRALGQQVHGDLVAVGLADRWAGA